MKRRIHERASVADKTDGGGLAIFESAASAIGHEVGNFLNKFFVVTRMLDSESLSDYTREMVGLLHQEAEDLGRFIEKFLNAVAERKLRPSTIDFEVIVLDVVKDYDKIASEKNIRIETEGFEGLPEASVDLQLMRQTLDSLVENAVEAVQCDGAIKIEGKAKKQDLMVILSDDGPGMDSQTASKIFEPFFSTKSRKGAGLGLATVKSVVEAHRGNIRCDTNPGEGTSFVLRIPLK